LGDYIQVALRIITVIPVLVVVALLVMGRRPIAELPVFDFLVLVLMGAIVGADLADPSVPHGPTVLAVVLLGLLQRVIASLSIRWRTLSRLVTFEPQVIIEDGRMLPRQMAKVHYGIDDVLMLLREQGVFDPAEVHTAVLEQNGRLSILRKADAAPATPKVLGVPVRPAVTSTSLVEEGNIREENLQRAGITRQELLAELEKRGLRLEAVFYASAVPGKGVYVVPFDD